MKLRTHPDSFSCPFRIPTDMSLSSGEPNEMNCRSFFARKRRFVVSSNRFVMWSSESAEPYLEPRSFSVQEGPKLVSVGRGGERMPYTPSRNSRARRLTNTDPANRPAEGCGECVREQRAGERTVRWGNFLYYERVDAANRIRAEIQRASASISDQEPVVRRTLCAKASDRP